MGQRVGPYEIHGELGRGGAGVVYRARRPDLGRDVALKVLSLPKQGLIELERFEREIAVLAQLRHPNIVTIHEAGRTEQGVPWLAMELVEGASLDNRLKAAPLEVIDAVEIARQVCDALEYSHRQGVIHRDVKPANVLIDHDGRAHLTDFGLAQLVTSEGRITQSGEILGTPDFMAPEQARGAGTPLGSATDVYSLGAMLYTCLTGSPPFKAATVIGLLHRITTEPAPRASLKRPEVDQVLDAICYRCMAKNPTDRYGSARELGFALEAWARGTRAATKRPTSRLVGATGVVLLLGASFAFFRSRSPEPTPTPAPPPTQAAAKTPTSVPPRVEDLAALERKVRRSIRVCSWKAARDACDRALRQRPDCVWALAQRGLARHSLAASIGAFVESRRDLDRAVALGPRSVLPWVNRARVCLERGDGLGGVRDLTAALELAPNDPAILVERAYAHAKLHDGPKARADVAAVVRISPDSAHGFLARALLRRLEEDRSGALGLVEEALQRDPASLLALAQRAILLPRLGRFRAALGVFDRWVEAAPGSYITWVGRASVHETLRELPEALANMREAFARMPPDHSMRGFYEREVARIREELKRQR